MSHIIHIRGTIVDAWFDAPFFNAEIEAGILTPSTRFVRELRAAVDADGDPIEIHVNSVGGDVFAGGEMLAAIQDSGARIARIVVGGIAASMAANIALMAGRPLAVHTNSILFFHSATSSIWGGPGAHSDEADLLAKINAPMIARLKEAGVDAERVDAGFSDGRNLSFDAEECRQYLGAEIIGQPADAPARPDAQTLARLEHPAAQLDRLAEYTATLRNVARCAAWEPEAAAAVPANAAADGDSDSDDHAQSAMAELERIAAENTSLEKQLRSVQSATQRKINELTARLGKAESDRDDALAKLEEITGRVKALTESLAAEQAARAALVCDVMAPDSDIESTSATPHIDRLATITRLDERLAYIREHRDALAAERERKH